MKFKAAGIPALCDEISDELGCEMSRDSTAGRQLDRAMVNGRPKSRSRTTWASVWTELRCDIPRVQRRYEDRASPRPNCSSAASRRLR
jgi:hypothetical protein